MRAPGGGGEGAGEVGLWAIRYGSVSPSGVTTRTSSCE